MIAEHFLRRPVLASVSTIAIVLAGVAAFVVLPLALYPQTIAPPITITARYPGASAETIAGAVAAPIEEQLSGVEGLLYFVSVAASNGTLTVIARFDVGTNLDAAILEVNNRVRLAEPRLPEAARREGLLVQKRVTDSLLFAAFFSPRATYDALAISNFARLNVVDELKRIPGVADITMFGAREYAMRVWLYPDRMSQFGITTADIWAALRAQNAQYAVGRVGGEPAVPGQSLSLTVSSAGRLIDPGEFGRVVVRSGGPNGILYLKDVARVELGALDYESLAFLNGRPTVGLGVLPQPGSNAVEVADAVKARLEELKRSFPPDLEYQVTVDSTDFVRASISAIALTMLEAAGLVAIVVFLFLKSWRASLIPLIAVPVSLVGTFAGMWALGFSINTVTVFALALAIGIVVDDAIIVAEGIERHMRSQSMSAMQAALAAMREVSGAVVGIVLVLCAVFIPVAFVGGIAGQLYRQFAATLAIAVILSGFVALTLTPILSTRLLQPLPAGGVLSERFDRVFAAFARHLLAAMRYLMLHRRASLTGFAVVSLLGAVLLYATPRGFLPNEDQGLVIASIQLPDAAALERTLALSAQLRQSLEDDPAVMFITEIAGLDPIGGGNKTSMSTTYVQMKHWDQRSSTSKELAAKVSQLSLSVSEGVVRAFEPTAIQGLGAAGGFEFYVQSKTDATATDLEQVTRDLIAALNAHPKIAGTITFYRANVPQLRVNVQREKALALGVPIEAVYEALQATIGTQYVNDFNQFGRTYRVQMQAAAEFRRAPPDLGRVFVRSSSSAEMVPAKALIDVEQIVGPEQLDHFNGLMAARILGSGKPGVSSRDAIDAVEAVAANTLPDGYSIAWTGQAYQELQSGNSALYALAASIVMVLLILAGFYERWSLPLAIIAVIPVAIAGALVFIWLRGKPNDIYFQIGLLVLVGLAAKNAILIVELAQQKVLAGSSPADAALEAARVRLRPIAMTSFAFMVGVAPLMFSSGAGAAARQSIGTGVFGGMLISTLVGTAFVPLLFVITSGFARRRTEGVS